ncbi:MAG: site-specific DNA-methyltransferase [Thaumarchaeota archaeon]|nr:site-specific DNA-methyltransferase [Nitrososphaerota archaeon]
MLIKGNNLIALHSLRKLYANQIDLIYIDPPYNTNNDTFAYNDRFNHSTWLTFIKNRIEVAKSLLKETGIIFISIDENEQAYLRILCDEIFGKLNLVNQFIWVNNLRGRLISNTGAARTHEYILVYAKNINSISEFSASPQLLTKLMPDTYKGYNHEVKRDEFGEYIITNELHNSNSKFNEKTRPNLVFDIYYKPKTGDIKCEDVTNNHLHHGYEKISPHPNIKCAGALYHAWRWGRERILKDSRELEFVNTNHGYKIYTKRRNINKATIKDLITNITTDSGSEDLSKLIPDTQINHPKPISLLNILLQCMKSDGIILDFFAGSGTTGDATLKLNKEDGGNRKFILIEQLDEHVEICKQRLQKVLERENINDSVIYFELAKFNRIAKEKINNCQNLEELINLFDELYSQYFLHYNLQVSEFKNEIKADDFKNLSLEEQKKCFVSVLNLNQMYINKSEMDDAKFNLSEDNKKLTNQFYNQNETKFI